MNTNNPASAVKPTSRPTTWSLKNVWNDSPTIVLGIDIGNAYSRVSYAFLQKGGAPLVRSVTQGFGSESNIPTMAWYNANQTAVLVGAEALSCTTEEGTKHNNWTLVKDFRSYLYPNSISEGLASNKAATPDPLPHGINLQQVYTDFMRYLIMHTEASFKAQILGGSQEWLLYSPTMEIVFTYLCEGTEQDILRRAAIDVGLVDSTRALVNIHFVTDVEAKFYFNSYHSNVCSYLSPGDLFALCDAGYSTFTTTLFRVQDDPLRLQLEVSNAGSIQAGLGLIAQQAKMYLRRLLGNTGLPCDEMDEYTEAGANDLVMVAGQAFDGTTEFLRIRLGDQHLNIPKLGIRRGMLKLTGTTVQLIFDQCINNIIVNTDLQIAGNSVPHIFLSGSFGETPYLRKKLTAWFEPLGTQVTVTNEPNLKAAADGAVIWGHTRITSTRSTCYTLGVEFDVPFDPDDGNGYSMRKVHKHSGEYVTGKWLELAHAGVPIRYDKLSRHAVTREYRSANANLGSLNEVIYANSSGSPLKWLREPLGTLVDGVQKRYTIKANLNSMKNALQPRINTTGSCYWTLAFNICLTIGRVKMVGFLEWVEGPAGIIKTMPVEVVSEPEA